MIGFAPIDMAKLQESQGMKTRHVGSSKRAFRVRLRHMFMLCSCKIVIFLGVVLWTSNVATSKSMFRARLPSIFSTSYKMPRLPRSLHVVTIGRSPDNAIRKNTQHDTSKVLRVPRKMTMDTSKVLRLPRNAIRLKCCGCNAKWRWWPP